MRLDPTIPVSDITNQAEEADRLELVYRKEFHVAVPDYDAGYRMLSYNIASSDLILEVEERFRMESGSLFFRIDYSGIYEPPPFSPRDSGFGIFADQMIIIRYKNRFLLQLE